MTEDGGRRKRAEEVDAGVIFAQPIPATLSTVKTLTLTTGDHNRAYLPTRSPFVPSRSNSSSLHRRLSAASTLSPIASPLLLTRYRRILSRNFRIDSREGRKTRKEKRRVLLRATRTSRVGRLTKERSWWVFEIL